MANYIELTQRIDAAVADRALAPIPVRRPYANVGLNERWHEEPSGERWRLIEPDVPFKGLFERIGD